MTIEEVRQAIDLVRADGTGTSHFAGKRPEALVAAAERALGFSFQPPYRRFVLELGAGSVGAEEIFGVTSSDFEDSTIPNGVWLTLAARREWQLPDSMLILYFDGGADYYVLDRSTEDPAVTIWRPGVTAASDRRAVVAADFGSFFLGIVRAELGDE